MVAWIYNLNSQEALVRVLESQNHLGKSMGPYLKKKLERKRTEGMN
jgi:hypothetical protein